MGSPREAWRRAASFAELCRLAAAFLRGELGCFPGWGAPDTDEETDRLEGVLLAGCAAGILPLASQEGGAGTLGHDGRPEQRRAFLCAFVQGFDPRPLEARGITILDEAAEEVPLGVRGGEVFLALGPGAREAELEIFREALCPAGLAALEAARWVTLVDLTWGRRDHLWSELAAELGTRFP